MDKWASGGSGCKELDFVMTKKDLIEIVEALPDDTPFELVASELRKARVVAEIKAGLSEIARGESVGHEEIKRRAAEWKSQR